MKDSRVHQFNDFVFMVFWNAEHSFFGESQTHRTQSRSILLPLGRRSCRSYCETRLDLMQQTPQARRLRSQQAAAAQRPQHSLAAQQMRLM
jgi:hypothetical protein